MNSLICLLILSAALSVTVLADDYEHLYTDNPTIVHLFEWKWTDIAAECENFLQHNGYGAVQISVPYDHIQGDQWWTRYQPVSYKLCSRGGNEDQFKDMVQRCNAVGVRIIPDVVNNHMCGVGAKGSGICGSGFDGSDGVEKFPGVPFGPNDFNDKYCHGDIQGGDYTCCADHVRRCRLVGLLDLNHDTDYVRGKIADSWNEMIDIGVAGLRMDAAKHMYPGNIKAMLDKTKNLRSDIFGDNKRAFTIQEVIDHGGEAVKGDEYTGRFTNFKYGSDLTQAVRRGKNFKYLYNFGEGWGYWAGHDVVVFVDDHDTQRDDSHDILTYKDGAQYQLAVGFMLSWNYGIPRVLSGYKFSGHDQGPPGDSPQFGADGTCTNQWACEHRWPATRRMAQFRAVAQGSSVTNIIKDVDNCLAFARQGKGYFALNNGFNDWGVDADTSLPSGTYCDVYTGEKTIDGNGCTGKSATVDGSGKAHLTVGKGQFFAIHLNTKL